MTQLKTDPVEVEIEGKTFKCFVCDNVTFHKRKTHLDTSLTSTMTPNWTNAEAYCLVCDRCGHVEWFLSR